MFKIGDKVKIINSTHEYYGKDNYCQELLGKVLPISKINIIDDTLMVEYDNYFLLV